MEPDIPAKSTESPSNQIPESIEEQMSNK